MNVLFVPSIGLDVSLLERLAASVDFPVDYKLAWNNGPLGALDSFARLHRDWIVKDSAFGNLGCSGSWNQAAKVFPDEPAILLINEDAYFLPGQLEQLCSAADHNRDAPLIHVNDGNAFYCFCWTRAGRAQFGTFDENLWPAYYEDTDMRIRHRLAGITTYPYALQGQTPVPHGKPRTGGDNYAGMINGCGLFNRAYMIKKWGGYGGESIYQTPYRDHRLKPSEWVWYPEERAKRFPIWDCFINMPNANIYE